MARKLDSIRLYKLSKRIKFLHVLLIILILVVFWGLFKTEIRRWKVLYYPEERIKTIEQSYPCKKQVNNPAYQEEFNKVAKPCLNDSKKLIECIKRVSGEIKTPRTFEEDSTCTSIKEEYWFWAFGRYWFKLK